MADSRIAVVDADQGLKRLAILDGPFGVRWIVRSFDPWL